MRQITGMVAEMRSILTPAYSGIVSVSGGSLFDNRLPDSLNGRGRFGPFKTVSELHRYLRRGVEARQEQCAEIKDLIKANEGTSPICFTHADSSSLNIRARGSGRYCRLGHRRMVSDLLGMYGCMERESAN